MASPDAVESVVRKVELLPTFTQDEVEAVKEMVKIWEALGTLGRSANTVRKILAYIGWLIALYVGVKLALSEWVRGIR